MEWILVTTSKQQMEPNKGYIVAKEGVTEFTLPPSDATNIGDELEITCDATLPRNTGWKILQNENQQIAVLNEKTTLGEKGSVDSLGAKNSSRIVCVNKNPVTWNYLSNIGSSQFN